MFKYTYLVSLVVLAAPLSAQAKAWTHPVATGERVLPQLDGSKFGAHRGSERPAECGAGHCGVDLYGTRGTPVVAVSDGVIEKVVRSSRGSSGRYVQISHDGGVSSYYMHLDAIREDLLPGAKITAGECLGTIGKTGIHHSNPHLHFGVSVKRNGNTRYVNPLRYLTTATVVDPSLTTF